MNNEFNTNGRLVDIKSFTNKLELPTLRRMRGKYIQSIRTSILYGRINNKETFASSYVHENIKELYIT